MSGSNLHGAFDPDFIDTICRNIKNVMEDSVKVSIVVGGGNIIRGKTLVKSGCVDRITADSMGMMATVMNGLIMQRMLFNIGVDSYILSPFSLPFGIKNIKAESFFEDNDPKRVAIFVGGTGYPYFSTDTSSVLNAVLSRSDVVLKATKTDGIYDKDPAIFEDAVFIPEISYKKALELNLKIMDTTAFSMAMEHNIRIIVFSIFEKNCFKRALRSEIKSSVVS